MENIIDTLLYDLAQELDRNQSYSNLMVELLDSDGVTLGHTYDPIRLVIALREGLTQLDLGVDDEDGDTSCQPVDISDLSRVTICRI